MNSSTYDTMIVGISGAAILIGITMPLWGPTIPCRHTHLLTDHSPVWKVDITKEVHEYHNASSVIVTVCKRCGEPLAVIAGYTNTSVQVEKP